MNKFLTLSSIILGLMISPLMAAKNEKGAPHGGGGGGHAGGGGGGHHGGGGGGGGHAAARSAHVSAPHIAAQGHARAATVRAAPRSGVARQYGQLGGRGEQNRGGRGERNRGGRGGNAGELALGSPYWGDDSDYGYGENYELPFIDNEPYGETQADICSAIMPNLSLDFDINNPSLRSNWIQNVCLQNYDYYSSLYNN